MEHSRSSRGFAATRRWFVWYSDWSRVAVNGITLSDALTCWERGQNEHNGAFRRRPGTIQHDADIYLLTGFRYLRICCFFFFLSCQFIHSFHLFIHLFCCDPFYAAS